MSDCPGMCKNVVSKIQKVELKENHQTQICTEYGIPVFGWFSHEYSVIASASVLTTKPPPM